VLGCLVEKQLTTPQQYPLTLNALVMAVNQATNRDPVVALDDDAVLAAVDELRSRHLLRVVLPSHGRSVKRYRHVLDEAWGLDPSRAALLAALLLRGPQTVGELRARTERMVDLPTVGAVQEELSALAGHVEGLVRLLARRPGQKEDRWQQTVAAPWGPDAGGDGDADGPRSSHVAPPAGTAGAGGGTDDPVDGVRSVGAGSPSAGGPPARASDRAGDVEQLRSEVASLSELVSGLRRDLDALRDGLGG